MTELPAIALAYGLGAVTGLWLGFRLWRVTYIGPFKIKH